MALETWNIDTSHSSITFSVRHLVISKVRGSFTRWTGALNFDPENIAASSVSVEIDATSIDTREEKRDAHLRSPDFLGTDENPKILFKSKKVEATGDRLKITGDLTIHGVTKETVLDAETHGLGKDPWGGTRFGFSAKATVNRNDFGVKFNQVLETGGVMVGEKLEIDIDIEAVKAAKAA